MESATERESDVSFTDFVRGQGASLYRTAYLLTGHRKRAEDVVQSASTKICRAWPGGST